VVPFTQEAVAAVWPEVVEEARGEGRFLSEALAACEVVGVAPPRVRLRLPPEQAVLAGAVERGKPAVERILATRVGAPVTLAVEAGERPAVAERPQRLSEGALNAERLKGLRGVDPALDAAVDELDLEIVDERPPRP